MANTPFDYVLNQYQMKRPLGVIWEISTRCNFRCTHCWHCENLEDNHELTYQEVEQVLLNLKQSGVMFIVFTGGEPFIRKDFLNILRFASDLGFGIRIFSNAQLVTDETIDFLNKINLLSLDITLYGNPGSDKFYVLLKTIEKMKKVLGRVDVSILWTDKNFDSRKDIREWTKENNLTLRENYFIFPSLTGTKINQKMLKDESIVVLIEENRKFARTIATDSVCGNSECLIAISKLGEVYPCIQIRKKMGNLLQSSFSDILSDNMNMLMFKETLTHMDLDSCKVCEIKEFCNNLCVGFSYNYYGDIKKRFEPVCKTTNIISNYHSKKSSV